MRPANHYITASGSVPSSDEAERDSAIEAAGGGTTHTVPQFAAHQSQAVVGKIAATSPGHRRDVSVSHWALIH